MISHVITWGRPYWTWFLIVTSLAFIIPEVFALITNAKNTLSDYAWYELNVKTPQEQFSAHSAAWFLSMGMWIVIAVWLTYHIWFERFT
jgi:archaellum biogenesis protein FlaJ (TadC family)